MARATVDSARLPDDQIVAAGDAARTLVELLATDRGDVHLQVGEREQITLPDGAVQLIVRVLSLLAEGDGVAIVPERVELTTQQTADILNVSRPFVVQLVDDRKLPARKVGTHRRILLRDVVAYHRRQEADREQIMRELATESQQVGLDY